MTYRMIVWCPGCHDIKTVEEPKEGLKESEIGYICKLCGTKFILEKIANEWYEMEFGDEEPRFKEWI